MSRILGAALMITGITVGIGIFGLPVLLGLTGIVPSLAAMACLWLAMYCTGSIIATGIIDSGRTQDDLPGFFSATLGMPGRLLTVFGYLLLLYGLLVAHLSAGVPVFAYFSRAVLPDKAAILILFAATTVLTLLGLRVIERANAFFMLLLLGTFLLLVALAGRNIEVPRYRYTDWAFLPSTLPIIATALAYHPIIPSVCRGLDYDRSAVRKALLLGTLIPLAINVLWSLTVIGALPLAGEGEATILAAFTKNEPATVPLALAYTKSPIEVVTMAFSAIALTVSYVLQASSLRGFFRDLISTRAGERTALVTALLTFLPPLVVVLIYPKVFLTALDLIGGVSIMLLFGILPALVALRSGGGSRWHRAGALTLLLLFSTLMVLELLQEAGYLRIKPEVEYWFFQAKAGP